MIALAVPNVGRDCLYLKNLESSPRKFVYFVRFWKIYKIEAGIFERAVLKDAVLLDFSAENQILCSPESKSPWFFKIILI